MQCSDTMKTNSEAKTVFVMETEQFCHRNTTRILPEKKSDPKLNERASFSNEEIDTAVAQDMQSLSDVTHDAALDAPSVN